MEDPDYVFDAELKLTGTTLTWRILTQPEWMRRSNRGDLPLLFHVSDDFAIMSVAEPEIQYSNRYELPNSLSRGRIWVVYLRGDDCERDDVSSKVFGDISEGFRIGTLALEILKNPDELKKIRIALAVKQLTGMGR
jgi:hypothetical protein